MSDARPKRSISSASLLFGVAAAFLSLASLIGLAVDAGDAMLGAAWPLRGTLIPPGAPGTTPILPSAARRV